MKPRFLLATLCTLPEYTFATQTESNSRVVSGGSIFTMLLALAATLAMIAVVAWLMKRLPQRAFGAPALLKVISSVAVGARERVVVVEAGDTWLVLGVAPGCVNALHQLPRQEANADANKSVPPAQRFAGWLKNAIEQRNRG
jgi:flagellar protein FliO/FliZ